jgi:hypothetical protein
MAWLKRAEKENQIVAAAINGKNETELLRLIVKMMLLESFADASNADIDGLYQDVVVDGRAAEIF